MIWEQRAYQLHQQGKTLDEIQRVLKKEYNGDYLPDEIEYALELVKSDPTVGGYESGMSSERPVRLPMAQAAELAKGLTEKPKPSTPEDNLSPEKRRRLAALRAAIKAGTYKP